MAGLYDLLKPNADELNKSQVLDRSLIAANASILAGYFFIFDSEIKFQASKWCLILAFTFLIISLCLLIWHYLRFPLRIKLMEVLTIATAKEFEKRIQKHSEEVIKPLGMLHGKQIAWDEASKVKNKKDAVALLKKWEEEDIEKREYKMPKGLKMAELYHAEAVAHHIAIEASKNAKQAFNEPLDENKAVFKFRLDLLARKARRELFISGSIFTVIAMYMELIVK